MIISLVLSLLSHLAIHVTASVTVTCSLFDSFFFVPSFTVLLSRTSPNAFVAFVRRFCVLCWHSIFYFYFYFFTRTLMQQLWSKNPNAQTKMVKILEKIRPKVILSTTCCRLLLNILVHMNRYDKFYVQVEQMMKVCKLPENKYYALLGSVHIFVWICLFVCLFVCLFIC